MYCTELYHAIPLSTTLHNAVSCYTMHQFQAKTMLRTLLDTIVYCATYHTLYSVCITLYPSYYVLYTECCILHTAYYILHTMYLHTSILVVLSASIPLCLNTSVLLNLTLAYLHTYMHKHLHSYPYMYTHLTARRYALDTIYEMTYTTFHALCAMCCIHYTKHYAPHTTHYILHTIYYMLYSV